MFALSVLSIILIENVLPICWVPDEGETLIEAACIETAEKKNIPVAKSIILTFFIQTIKKNFVILIFYFIL